MLNSDGVSIYEPVDSVSQITTRQSQREKPMDQKVAKVTFIYQKTEKTKVKNTSERKLKSVRSVSKAENTRV